MPGVIDSPETVAINGRFLSQTMTGVQRYACEIVHALDHEIMKGRIEVGNRRVVVAVPRNVDVPDLKAIEVVSAGRLRGHLWEQWDFRRIFRRSLKLNLCGAAPIAGLDQIVTFHDAAVFSAPQAYSAAFRVWYRALFRHQGKIARRVITVSAFSRAELTKHCGIPPERLAVIPPSAEHILRIAPDVDMLQRFGLRAGRFALCVGSIQPNKNVQLVVDAGRQLENSPFEVVVAGGGDALPSSGIRFLGRVSDHELRALYGNAFCLIFPSLYEGFGIPALEAMECGCPVLAARAAAIPETCGDAAQYFDPRSSTELAIRLESLYGNRIEQERLRALGYRRAKVYSWRRAAHQLWDVLAPQVSREEALSR